MRDWVFQIDTKVIQQTRELGGNERKKKRDEDPE